MERLSCRRSTDSSYIDLQPSVGALGRVRIQVQGIVQGVGFRPFCYNLAASLGLNGKVFNDGRGVVIEVEGEKGLIDRFIEGLKTTPPPLSKITSIEVNPIEPLGEKGFSIVASQQTLGRKTQIPPDVSVCDDCLRELLDERDPRYLYPFINCTNCGPRYTIIQSLPYDRPRTTMSSFELCSLCEGQYRDPTDRRFHAEPVSCPTCGPHLWLTDNSGKNMEGEPLSRAAAYLREGNVIGIKGLGGFHIACDAFSEDAVKRIRSFKLRPSKPLAVMAKDITVVRRYFHVSKDELMLLTGLRRPIVLLRPKNKYKEAFSLVSPGIATVGVMLPYTPIHFLLMGYYRAPELLVMTSGNPKGAPILKENVDALEGLSRVCHYFLLHNRPIERRVDDSVTMVADGRERIVRRARGYAPLPVVLSREVPSLVAFGADLKNAIAVSQGKEVFLSQYIGDLTDVRCQDHLLHTIEDLTGLLGIEPQGVVVDLHPDYCSTRLGVAYAEKKCIPVHRVQHHHAHMLSVMAEHGLHGPAIGCIMDGTGLGEDGTIWGGEIIFCNNDIEKASFFVRLAHLEHMRLPGGDRAAKEPWRMALSVLYKLLGRDALHYGFKGPSKGLREFFSIKGRGVVSMLEKDINAPLTSSCGRLFDAVAAILGVTYINDYEARAAMELEALSKDTDDHGYYPVSLRNSISYPWEIAWGPMVKRLLGDVEEGVPIEVISHRFHQWLASSLLMCILHFANGFEVKNIIFSGGCMQNRSLTSLLSRGISTYGLNGYWGETVPVNDGGIALGQIIGGGAKHVSCSANGGT